MKDFTKIDRSDWILESENFFVIKDGYPVSPDRLSRTGTATAWSAWSATAPGRRWPKSASAA
jgi:hypothetical protein